MAARRTRATGRGRSSAATRRKFIWARAQNGLVVAAQGFTTSDLLSGFEALYGAQLLGVTVTRIRGTVSMNFASSVDTQSSAWGIRVATGDPTEVDGPAAEPHADWMAYGPIVLQTGGAAGTDATAGYYVRDVDVRAMRRLDELDQTLVLSVSNTVAAVAADFRFHLSIGLKLP